MPCIGRPFFLGSCWLGGFAAKTFPEALFLGFPGFLGPPCFRDPEALNYVFVL